MEHVWREKVRDRLRAWIRGGIARVFANCLSDLADSFSVSAAICA
jgi:hypothetical protein